MSEVIRAALRLFEYEETKKAGLMNELRKGEESGFVKNFDRQSFLTNLRKSQI
ncbi:type II toxin-antitoxin system ParD family antitoxin [Albibacterium indicum]|uniref:type II toxin-antitoxin system ParD family antitoxin n=1 Tax=Albibacterium indicum TaxID=2292082 RepID=UPI00197E30E4